MVFLLVPEIRFLRDQLIFTSTLAAAHHFIVETANHNEQHIALFLINNLLYNLL